MNHRQEVVDVHRTDALTLAVNLCNLRYAGSRFSYRSGYGSL